MSKSRASKLQPTALFCTQNTQLFVEALQHFCVSGMGLHSLPKRSTHTTSSILLNSLFFFFFTQFTPEHTNVTD